MMVFDDRNSCASTIPMDRLATALISNKTSNSPASERKNSITCKQKIDSSNKIFCKYPDCAPLRENKKKTVTFTTNIASSSATSAPCVSRTEHSAAWYTSKELAEIAKLAKSAMQMARLSETETKEKDSLRGLEYGLSIRANQEMKARKLGVALAVLKEQSRQKINGISDASRIRIKCKMASRKSKTLAIEYAEQDTKDAFETEFASPRLNRRDRGLPDYSSPRKNTRTNSLRRLSAFDAKRLADVSVPYSSRKFLDPQQL